MNIAGTEQQVSNHYSITSVLCTSRWRGTLRPSETVKDFVAPEAKNVVNTRRFLAPLHCLVAAVMTIATHKDFDVGPMPADASDDMLEDRANLFARWRLALAQDHRHWFAACCFVDVDRQEAALVIMGVKQRELLMAVHRVAGIVDVKRNRDRRVP